jgi:SAM-dependent methyltransferase
MRQARTKLSALAPAWTGSGRLDFLGLDVELNRFLPVRQFLSGEIVRFQTLSERIENLPLQSAERIDAAFSPRLHRILRGETITPAADQWLKSQFELDEYRIILDFNLAVRFVRGRMAEKPAFRKLGFGGKTEQALHLPFRNASFNKILMSLVLSYIFDPIETLKEIRRIIVPGGLLVLSSMRPDADASGLFTRLVAKLEALPPEDFAPDRPKTFLLNSIRTFLNNAQALVELEEAGTFDFFDPARLDGLLDEAGWEPIDQCPSFGTPPQGYIITARPREIHES